MASTAKEDDAVVGALIDVAEAILGKALRIYKQRPRKGPALDALHDLEVCVQKCEGFRVGRGKAEG